MSRLRKNLDRIKVTALQQVTKRFGKRRSSLFSRFYRNKEEKKVWVILGVVKMDELDASNLGKEKVTDNVNNEINISKEEINSKYVYFFL